VSDQILINGIAHSWGSIGWKIDGEGFTGLSSISYSDKLETAKGYGIGRAHKPRARSRGKYVPEQVVTKVQTSTAQDIRDALAARGPDGVSYGIAEVPMVLQYLEIDDSMITIEFERCRLVEDGSSDEEGPDVLTVELKWDIMGIKRNGKTLYQAR
jgi:hypothetical protein